MIQQRTRVIVIQVYDGTPEWVKSKAIDNNTTHCEKDGTITTMIGTIQGYDVETPEPPAPTWKAGDWAYCSLKMFDGEEIGICQMTKSAVETVRQLDGTSITIGQNTQALRPLTDADWTREFGGVRVRAYEDFENDIRIIWENGKIHCLPNPQGTALCSVAKIPIMPQALSKGKYI